MLKKMSFVAAMAVAGALLAGAPAYADPGDVVVRPGPVAGGGGTVAGGVHSAVVGYISIQYLASQGQTQPSYQLSGALADPTQWTCSDNWPVTPYKVTCVPASSLVVLDWHCDVLHADVRTVSAAARARTTLDCDGGATPPEAQTAIVTGPIGYDFIWSQSNVFVTQFSCTVDGGLLPAAPDYTAGCGDPGLPTIG